MYPPFLLFLTTWIGAKIILQGNKDTRGKLYRVARFIYSPVTYLTWYTKQSITIREMETLAHLLRNKKYNKIPFTKLDESTTVKECYLIDDLYKNILQKICNELMTDLTSDNPLKGEFEKYVICNNYISYRIVLPTGYVNMVVCTKKERTVGKEDRIDNVYIDRKDIVEIISRQLV